MARATQITSVTIPSIGQVPLKANESKFTPSGIPREHRPGQNPKDGTWFEKEPEPAKLEITLNDSEGVVYAAYNNVTDETITIEMSNGMVHMMDNAFCSEPSDPDKGDVKIVFLSNTSKAV